MNVLNRRSPKTAALDSLLHAAETSRSDDAFVAQALGSETRLGTPTAKLNTGLTEMLEELELSTLKPKPPATDPLACTSELKPKADGPVVIELGDSPPEPPKKAPRLHADLPPTGAAARLQMLMLPGLHRQECMQGFSVHHVITWCHSRGEKSSDARPLGIVPDL